MAPKTPRRTSLDEPIRLLNGASASESNRSNKEHRERQGGLWGRGLGCGRTAHIWSYDPSPMTRPQTHIFACLLPADFTMPCAQARRRQPSSRVQAQAYLSMLRSEEAAEATGPALQCVYHDARPRAGGASAPHAARRPHCHSS